MSFTTELADKDNREEFLRLQQARVRIVTLTQQWMDDAIALHGVVDAAKQAEIIADRQALIDALTAAITLP